MGVMGGGDKHRGSAVQLQGIQGEMSTGSLEEDKLWPNAAQNEGQNGCISK